jgi:hypothetical protein
MTAPPLIPGAVRRSGISFKGRSRRAYEDCTAPLAVLIGAVGAAAQWAFGRLVILPRDCAHPMHGAVSAVNRLGGALNCCEALGLQNRPAGAYSRSRNVGALNTPNGSGRDR